MNLVEINNVAIGIKEYEGKRVITFKDIDRVHGRPDGTASNAFKRHRQRFIEDEDYYHVTRNIPLDVRRPLGLEAIPPKGIILIAESGYLMISKVFDDDIAWDVQRKLVNNYFRVKETVSQDPTIIAMQMITETMKLMQQDISTIKEQQLQAQKQMPKKSFSRWTSKMFPKYQLLMDYFDIDRKELYHNLFLELQNLYPDIDLTQMQDDYCFENKLDSCFTMDVIEHNKELRTLFEHMINDLLDRYKLKSDSNEEYTIRKTIFT